jgi:hypothetical protein
MQRSRHHSTVVAVGVAALLAGTAGVATGAGAGAGPWLLGEQNHAKSTTKLVSPKALDKETVRIKNTGGGPALSLVTSQSGTPPFTVTSPVKVERLNADRVDGLDSSQLVRSDQDLDADTLNGKPAGAYVQVPANPLSALVLSTEAQAIPDTTLTGLGTYVEVYDPSDMHWAVNPSSMMPPRNGTYVVSATVTWAADADGWRSVELRSPSGVISRVTGPPAGASVPTVQTLTGLVHLDSQPGVTLMVSQASGGAPLDATMTAFEMAFVGS